MKIRMILATAAAACGVVILFAQLFLQRPSGPYTQDQAAAGRATYQTYCSSCHSVDLSGKEGPQLAGANFLAQWGDRTAAELITFMQSTMPPGGAALPGDSYLNLAAFILDANSARAGNQALTAASQVTIRSVASGNAPSQAPAVLAATRKPSKGSKGNKKSRRPAELPSRAK